MNGTTLAKYLTGNPWIFQQDLSDLQTRVNYLESKKFSKAAIARILTAARYWLNVKVEVIDERLGWFMKEFRLSGDELRFAVTKNPKLVTFGTGHVQFLLFALTEEMGFSKQDLKTIMLADPFVYTSYKEILLQSFDFLHNTLKLSHQDVLKFPKVLRCYASHLKNRHEFLKSRRLDQYDAEKPNYISLFDLASGGDETFCQNVAKCSINEYNRFLKRR
uniref:Uncharacterized protein n=1 Tax=Romanomermis culicivorax TaxID=13658 RepID=A0A915L157_ROMCU